jgi:hypothetical protein
MLDMVSDTRRMAFGSLNDQINLVGVDAAASDTSLIMDMDITGITPGMTLSSGLNVWYVKGIESSSKTVFVIPGFDNSPKTAVTAGDFVFIKPRVTDWYMFSMMNQEILRLSTPQHGLYAIKSWTDSVNATYQTYTVPDAAFNMIGILRIRYRLPGTTDVWVDIPEKSYRIQTGVSGSIIRLLRDIPSSADIEFLYKGPFTPATSLDDDVTTVCGLSSSMIDIPPLGCLSTLLRTTETRRNQVQQQGDARRAGEVASGANSNTVQMVERNHQMRIWEEASRLTQRIPIVRSI